MRRREDDREDEKRAGIDVACNVSLNATLSRKRFFLDTKAYRSIFFDTNNDPAPIQPQSGGMLVENSYCRNCRLWLNVRKINNSHFRRKEKIFEKE
jgi:hypothetical protein